jgi:enterochelin esterase-like enzyme
VPTWRLDSPILAILLGSLAAFLLLRSAPRLGARPGRTAGAALLLLAMASYLNAFFGYLPRVGDVAGPPPWPEANAQVLAVQPFLTTPVRYDEHPRGAVVHLRLAGAVSHTRTREALIYLPPQYFTSPTERFPVLYLLHGSPGVPLDWFRGGDAAGAGLAAAQLGHPVILVAPRMSTGWLADSECIDGPAFRAETYLTRDVVPQVDQQLRTQPTSGARGVAGNSAGGYCALALGLRHPGLFSKVAALSPLVTPSYSYGSLADLFGHPRDLRSVVQAHTPEWLLQHRASARGVHLLLDVGNADPVRRGVRRLFALDQELGGHAELVVRRGGHTYQVWRPALRAAVAWFAAGANG